MPAFVVYLLSKHALAGIGCDYCDLRLCGYKRHVHLMQGRRQLCYTAFSSTLARPCRCASCFQLKQARASA